MSERFFMDFAPKALRLARGFLGLAATVIVVVPANSGPVFARSASDAAFEAAARTCLDDYLRLNPVDATQLGDHRFDGTLADFSPGAIKENIATMRRHLAALDKIDGTQLTGPNRVDAQILRLSLEAQIFNLTEFRPQDWDPLQYNSNLSDGLYLLSAREFAPVEARLRNAARRLAALPTAIEQAKINLRNPPEIYTQTAIKQLNGTINLVHEGIDPLLDQVPALRQEIAPLQDKAVAALTAYKQWLEKDLLPRSHGDFRIGAELYRKRLKYALASDLSPETILSRAEKELIQTSDTLYETALPLFARYFPDTDAATRAEKSKVIKAVLDRLAQDHPDEQTIVAQGEKTIKLATEFVRSHDLVTLSDAPVKTIVTPEFRRGRSAAYCDSPGALEPNEQTFVAFEPSPSDWPETRKASFYREYNNYMMRDLLVHEAMPGHFLQLAHSNQFRAPTLVRGVFQSGSFIEGWAVYMERVMAETGFGGPETRMQQLKMRLRVIINAILDQKIHTAGMTKEQALELMMTKGFQEEGEAVAKWQRAQLSSTQLATYFVGTIEHDDLRTASEKKEGAAFNLKKYHDTVISFGSPAVKFVREEMGL